MEARNYRRLSRKLIECEERRKLMEKMIKHGVGFTEEEEFLIHEEKKSKGKNDNFWKERKGILALIMGRKLRDNNLLEGNLRYERDEARKSMGRTLGENSSSCRRIVKNTKDEGVRVRNKCKKKNHIEQ